MSAINVNSITGRTGTHGPVLTGVTTISDDLHVGSGLSVTGVSTFSNTVVGGATTELVVGGDARITGILTIGTGSVTIDGTSGNSSITGVTTVGITSAYITSINDLNYPTAGPLSNRNLIINGAMQVSQRFTSNTGQTASAYRACDRFQVQITTLGTWTIEQSNNAPADFVNSLRLECTTADASPASGDSLLLSYHVEAQDIAFLNFGTANAKSLVLSFWVRSNKTNTASISIRQPDASSRIYTTTYDFNATASTWKKVEIPIPADVAGQIDNDNGNGLALEWWLNSGSTFTGGGTTTGWEAFDDSKRNPTNAGIGGAVSDFFEITGVQLEVGSKATPFEHESYGQTLAKCQRYFQTSFIGDVSTTNTNHNGIVVFGGGNTSATTGFIGMQYVRFAPEMSKTPTVTTYDLANPRNVNKCHRHILGLAGTNNQSVSITDISPSGLNARSDSGVSATGIIFHFAAEAEL